VVVSSLLTVTDPLIRDYDDVIRIKKTICYGNVNSFPVFPRRNGLPSLNDIPLSFSVLLALTTREQQCNTNISTYLHIIYNTIYVYFHTVQSYVYFLSQFSFTSYVRNQEFIVTRNISINLPTDNYLER
jgi:hypothetical protein